MPWAPMPTEHAKGLEMSIASDVLAAAPALCVGEAAVVALPLSGQAFHAGRIYTKAVAHSQATRIARADEHATYVVYRHRAGRTIYLDPVTVLHTEPMATP